MQTLLRQATHKLRRHTIPEPYLDAEVLLASVLRQSRAWLLAHGTETVPARARKRFSALVARRSRYEPVAYLIGMQEFYGRPFHVTRAVLVPRPNTELLVEEALAHIPEKSRMTIADIGTGSGNIAVTIAAERHGVRILATDISPRALRIAAQNAAQHGVQQRLRFLRGSLLAPLQKTRPDMLLANLPYVPAAQQQRTAAERATTYEPAVARYGARTNRSGKDFVLRFLQQLHAWRHQPALVFLEVGHNQYAAIKKAAQQRTPAYHWSLHSPLGGKARVLIGRRYGSTHQQRSPAF